MQAEFLYNPPDKGLYCHAPTLLQTTGGDLFAAWYAYPEMEHVEASLVLSRRPAGQQWGPAKSILDNFSYSVGNPVLFGHPSGRIYLLFVLLKGNYWTDSVLMGSHSDDGGHSWSPQETLWHERGMMVRHPPVVLSDGSLLLPAYEERSHQSILLRSREPYMEWTEAYRFDDLSIIQPVLFREASRRLTLFFRPWGEPLRIWRSHSSDEGSTWSTPVRTPLPNPLSGIAAFAVRDHIALVYNHTEEHQRHPLTITVSRDGAITWGNPWHIDTISHEVSYPSFLCDGDGIVHGVYTYSRRMIKYVSFGAECLG